MEHYFFYPIYHGIVALTPKIPFGYNCSHLLLPYETWLNMFMWSKKAEF